jgi:hypothetical protein
MRKLIVSEFITLDGVVQVKPEAADEPLSLWGDVFPRDRAETRRPLIGIGPVDTCSDPRSHGFGEHCEVEV